MGLPRILVLSSLLVGSSLGQFGGGHGGHLGEAFGFGGRRPGFQGFGVPVEREVYPEWFDVNDPDDCNKVPDSVNTGKPRDLCQDAKVGEQFCICVKRGGSKFTGASSYAPLCGECRDPCTLRFVPDAFPRKRDKDTADDAGDNSGDGTSDY